MDGAFTTWTEVDVAAARRKFLSYIFWLGGSIIILTPFAVVCLAKQICSRRQILARSRNPCLTLALLFPVPIVMIWTFAPLLLVIALHTGFAFAGWTLVPQVMPNTCDVARQVESVGAEAWPCARDELIAAWHHAKLDWKLVELLTRNPFTKFSLGGTGIAVWIIMLALMESSLAGARIRSRMVDMELDRSGQVSQTGYEGGWHMAEKHGRD